MNWLKNHLHARNEYDLMSTTSPLVSVLMTAFNREKFIAEAIESVLASSYENFELIVVDDCSTDNTNAVARTFQATDKRIKVFVNDQNLGDYKNRNRAASLASGKYIKYLDSDDLIYPWGLEAMVYCMEKFPEAGLGLMSYELYQKTSYPILVPPVKAYRDFFFKNYLFLMGPSGAMIRADIFNEVQGFSGEPYVGDTEMWLRVGAMYPVVRMPFDLVWWRQHEGQQIVEEMKNKSIAVRRYQIYRERITDENCPLGEDERAIVLKNLENVRIRDILFNCFLHFKISQGLHLLRAANIPVYHFWKAFRRNSYPAAT